MLKELIELYPEKAAEYAEKILDSYFGNIFITYKNEKIIYVNAKMAGSIGMAKEELIGMTLEELREKKLWLRSLSQELYEEKKQAFNAYNVSKQGAELFTHVEPIFDQNGEIIMSAQFSIPKPMLVEFSSYIDQEKTDLEQYKGISDYLSSRKEASDEIIRFSPSAKLAFQNAYHISSMDSTVLICGATGTGKDVLANYIYHNSSRRDQPFVPVNCSAIPNELVESEFFGYERGAFTGARSSGKPGLFELANHGTLFLDEIGELPLGMQAKLLRVLETGEVMRIGGTKLIKTDVRVIAATNRDLKRLVQEKRFREDLYYRLNVMPLFLPPLRERVEDILPLANQFLSRNNRKYGQSRTLTEKMCESLLAYDWPGNIRELRNVIERYTISGQIDLGPVSAQFSGSNSEAGAKAFQITPDIPLHEACQQFEQTYIRQALDASDGSVAKAAKLLGIHRSLLYKKLKKGASGGGDPMPFAW